MSKNELSIVHVGKYGRRLTLNDGSKWDISPGDTSKTGLWYPTQRVIVKDSKSPVDSHILTGKGGHSTFCVSEPACSGR